MPSAVQELIFDVGMHNGDDTAYYLKLGYRVVGVEANRALADMAAERFSREVADGRLIILNCGIGREEGEAEFWVCDDHTEWSSFDPSIASRLGARHHAVQVPVRQFGSILDEHGLPHYCKIDIEGNDGLCLDEMSLERKPRFVSVEMDLEQPSLDRLSALGYNRFKVIDQQRICTPSRLFYRLRRVAPKLGQAALERAQRAVRCRREDQGWRFPLGSSGPIPEATPGRWSGHASTASTLRFLHASVGTKCWTEWFDIHATTDEALALSAERAST